MRNFGRLCASVLLVTLGGCSFVFVDAPPAQHKKLPYFSCTSSNALPVLDLVLGGLIGLAAVEAVRNESSGSTFEGDAWVGVAEAAAFAASGLYGLSKTSACREAQGELMTRLNTPGGYGPGFGGPPAAAPPGPPNDPWLNPPPGLFAPTSPAAPPSAPPPTAASPDGGAPTAPPASDDARPETKR
jgi:hypothetical protein